MADSSSVDFSKYAGTSVPEKATLLSQNIKEDHIYLHLDYTVLVAILIICITIILTKYLSNKKKESHN